MIYIYTTIHDQLTIDESLLTYILLPIRVRSLFKSEFYLYIIDQNMKNILNIAI